MIKWSAIVTVDLQGITSIKIDIGSGDVTSIDANILLGSWVGCKTGEGNLMLIDVGIDKNN